MAQGVRVNGGVQVGLAAPMGDFATKETSWGDHLGANKGLGCHLGGHLDVNFNPHHQLRFHLTLHAFVNGSKRTHDSDHDDWDDDDWDNWNSHDYEDDQVSNTFGIAQVGADYIYNFTSPSKGLYVLGGLHLNRVSKRTYYSRSDDYSMFQSSRGGVRVGAGYTFNRVVSVEAQINSISVDAAGVDGFGFDSLGWISMSAVFRFGRP